MEIAFLSPGNSYSESRPFIQQGSESVIYGISIELLRMGHDVHILGRFENIKSDEMTLDNGAHFINIRSQSLNDRRFYELGSAIVYSKAASKKLKELNLDGLGLNERFSAYFPSKLDLPKTFTMHNPDATDPYRKFAFNYNKLNYIFFNIKQKIEAQVISRSNVTIALTDSMKRYLLKKGFTNIVVMPNAIDIDNYFKDDDGNFILYAGRLNKVKGIEYLIRAFSLLNRNYNFKLMIIGSGPDEKRIKDIASSCQNNDRIAFVPAVTKAKLREYLSKCSFFVLPSLFEAFPIVLMEAMASGKAVIASDINGPNEIIFNGYNGLLFKKENIFDLRDCMECLISDIDFREKLGNRARETIEDKYTFPKVAREYLRIIQSIKEQP